MSREGKMSRMRTAIAVVGMLGLLVAPPAAVAQEREDYDERIRQLEEQVEQLRLTLEGREAADLAVIRRHIEAITAELERLRLGADVVRADTSRFGFGPAASKIYGASPGVSIGGYGEVLYENFAGEREDDLDAGARDRLDLLRVVLYAGYKFDEHFLLNTEIEFEHASTDKEGSASVEFAYLDYLFAEHAGVRAGLVLLPLGFLNELHEPTTWLGTERPVTENRIIPTTWREGGIGLFGDFEDFQVRGFVVNGLDAVGGGFSAEGIRDGRQKGSEALAEDLAVAVRGDYTGQPGLVVGASGYLGESGQGAEDPTNPGEELSVQTLIVEGHAGYRAHGFDLRALVATAELDDVAALNAIHGFTGDASIGERMTGWYVQGGYDVLRSAATSVELIPYVRYESVNTQEEVPEGFTADPANDLEIWTIGAALRPIPPLIVKTDYQIRSTAADTGVNQFDVALGYIF